MTYRKALKIIRENTRANDTLIDTFKTICQNRYCHPVNDWSIFDIAKAENLSEESARNKYNRHLRRLEQIFRAQLEAYLCKGMTPRKETENEDERYTDEGDQ